MKKAIVFVLLLIIAVMGVYYMSQQKTADSMPTEAHIKDALQHATIDVSEFGGEMVTLEQGEASFITTPGDSFPQGFVGMTEHHAIVFKGTDADVYTVVHINGGGTGTFQYLVQFEYVGATDTLAEIQKIPLGDRLIIDGVYTSQTAPTAYDVLVEIKERLVHEGMAAMPTQPQVLHFVRSESGLTLSDVTFGTIADPQVTLIAPLPGASVPETFTIQGAARGGWFFEASFPVQVRTFDGVVVANTFATAEGDWMTDSLVPFTATVSLPQGTTGLHALVISKDNPSGLPENDASIEIPIVVE